MGGGGFWGPRKYSNTRQYVRQDEANKTLKNAAVTEKGRNVSTRCVVVSLSRIPVLESSI